MIFYSILLLFYLLKLLYTHDMKLGVSTTLITFSGVKIEHLSCFKTWFSVLLNNSTAIVYSINLSSDQDPTLIEKLRFVLDDEKLDFAKPSNLLEFRLISDGLVLYCTNKFCRVCRIADGTCINYSLEHISAGLASLNAFLVNDDLLIVRSVNERGNGFIYGFKPNISQPVSFVADHVSITGVDVVGTFSNEQYVFFVGSATKIDIPFNLFTGISKRKHRMDLRVTRVCKQDKTSSFESRIDISLSCNGLDLNYIQNADNRAKSFSLSLDGKRFFVTMKTNWPFDKRFKMHHQQTLENTNDVICEFELEKVEKAFDNTWTSCQAIKDGYEIQNCKELGMNGLNTQECFLFAWQKSWRIPICERYNKEINFTDDLDNCKLIVPQINANRNGWLENYLPVMGRIVTIADSNTIFNSIESTDRNSLFVSRLNSIQRLLKSNQSDVKSLWFANISSSAIVLDEPFNLLIFNKFDKVEYTKISCSGLYPNCESISWYDPLKCGWCARVSGGGHSFSHLDTNVCENEQKLRNVCPPKITEVTFERGLYRIFGSGFDIVDDLNVATCDSECEIERNNSNNNVLRCHSFKFCAIKLTGKLGDFRNFKLTFDEHLNTNIIENENNNELTGFFKRGVFRDTRTIRVVVTIFVVFLFVLLLLLVWNLYRKYAERIKIKVRGQNKEKKLDNSIQKYMSVSSTDLVEDHFPLSFYNCQHLPYPQRSQLLNNKISAYDDLVELDRSQIYIMRHIGNGYSSKVHLAKLVNTEEPDKSRNVAVKTVNNSSFAINDIMREIELISKCNHKNIVEYIGHYSDDLKKMHIVTEFMAGGDLHEFLINENYKPTVGDAFLYILQICEGMEYLTKQHIIHRDLAARNCMLDADHVIVKITDFGLCRTSNVDYEYVSENSSQQLPFRWTAIECFGTLTKFSEKSDIWSFGVVAWEIFARNIQPYEGKDINGVRNYLKSGQRLEFDLIPACPTEIYERVMLPCWEEAPQQRPIFSKLRATIEHIYWGLENSLPEYLKTEYETPISSVGSLISEATPIKSITT